MTLFEDLRNRPDKFKKKGEFKKLRQGLYSKYCHDSNRYVLKIKEVVNYLTEEDCKAIMEDLRDETN